MELAKKSGLSARNKWCYSLGGIGRDMTYTLVSVFFLTYIQFGGLGLTVAQFAVIGAILIAERVWDAINDPVMGLIIENTKSKFGKFKPWILSGALLTAGVLIAMFNIRFTGWNFVVFFAVIIFLWELTFSMNDISYWALLPNLTSNSVERDKVTTLAVVFAGVGAFTTSAIVPMVTVGNAVQGYAISAIVIATILVLCQCLTVFGVKQQKNPIETVGETVSLKRMFKVIFKNDQLLWVTLAMLLYNIGSGLLVALGYNLVYMEVAYNGTLALMFVATFGICNIGTQCFYSKLVNKFGRKKLLAMSTISIVLGYTLLFVIGLLGYINIVTLCVFGIFVFVGQAIFYMILTVNLTNTIEYNEMNTGERNEAVIFSLRPFMAKMGSALQQGIVVLVLTATLIVSLTNRISLLEEFRNVYDKLPISQQNILQDFVQKGNENYDIEQYKDNIELYNIMYKIMGYDKPKDEQKPAFDSFKEVKFEKGTVDITLAADDTFNSATPTMRFWLRFAVSIVPAVLIILAFIVLRKKYVIDEPKYEEILTAIEKNKNLKNRN
ncbi:MAG: glycoside-pentoside-hexuronide (GPH):cation symporter [Clostridia bacterium]